MSSYTVVLKLDPKELEEYVANENKINDEHFLSGKVKFENGNSIYELLHVNHDKPYILFRAYGERDENFENVKGDIENALKEIFEKEIKISGEDDRYKIELPSKLTQETLADIVKKYSEKFEEMKIELYFYGVPETNCNLKLPEKKLILIEEKK